MYGQQPQGSGMLVQWPGGMSAIGQPGKDQPQRAVLDETIEHVSLATKRLSELAGRACSIADAVFGGAPIAATGSAGLNPQQPSKAHTLSTELRALHQIIDDLSTQVDRLTCI